MRQDPRHRSTSPTRHRLSVSSAASDGPGGGGAWNSGPLSGAGTGAGGGNFRSPHAHTGPMPSPGPYAGSLHGGAAGAGYVDSMRFSDFSFSGDDSFRRTVPRRSALQSPGPPPPRRSWWASMAEAQPADGGWSMSLSAAMSPMVAPMDVRARAAAGPTTGAGAPSHLASEYYAAANPWETPRYFSVHTPVYGGWREQQSAAWPGPGGGREFLEQWRDREVVTPGRSFVGGTPRDSFTLTTPRRSGFHGWASPAPSELSRPSFTGDWSASIVRPRESFGLRSPIRVQAVDPEEGLGLTEDDGLKSSVWDYTIDSHEDLLPSKAGKKLAPSEGVEEDEEGYEHAEEAKAGQRQAVGFVGLFAYADFLDKLLMLLGALGAIVNGGSLPWYSLLFGNLVNTLGHNQNATDKLMAEVIKICYYMIGLSAIVLIGSYFEVTCFMLAADRQATRIRTKFLRAVLRQDVAFFDTEASTGEVMNSISADVAIIQDAIGEKVGNFIHHLATFVSGYIVGFIKSWQVSLVVFAVTPLMIICGKVQRSVYIDLASKEEAAYLEAGSVAEQALSAIRTVYSFVAEDTFTTRYSELLANSLPYGLKVGFARGCGIGIIYLVMYGTWALALWYGSVLISQGKVSGGDAIACFFGVIVGGKGLGLAAPYLVNFAQGGVAAHRVFGLIERVPAIDIDNDTGKTPDQVKGMIEYKKVSFTYPARPDVEIFRSFSLTVPAGRTVALVGASGSGKSTAFALLERFYDPDKGAIYLDGVNIRELQLRWLRKQIGLVGQEPVLFATTIKDNILHGREGASMKEIVEAAKAANAHSFIQTLTHKYDTQVGERGVQLSGGQKQRVAIARAILKDPRVLLLDEATSALDTESEEIVQDALDRMMVKRTTIVIAHRLSTIRNADIIAVVSKGEVVESGRHEYLMSKGGAYFSLVNMAAASMQRGPSLETIRNSEGMTPLVTTADGMMTPMMTPQVGIRTSSANPKKAELKASSDVVKAPEKQHVSLASLLVLSKAETPLLLLGLINAINAGIIFPFFAFIMGQVVYIYFNPDHHKMRDEVNRWAIVYVGLGFLAIIAMTGQHGFINWAGIKLTKKIREKLFESLLRQEVGWFDQDENTSGAILSRLSVDSTFVRGVLGDRISILVMGTAAIGVGLIICAILNWKMTLVAVAVTPVFIGANYMQIILNVGIGGNEDAYARAGTIAAEAVANIRTVSSFSSEDKIVNLFNQALSVPLKGSLKRAQAAGAGLGLSQALMYGGYTLTLWYGATLVHKGETNFGVVLKIFLILILSSFSVGQIAQMAPDSSKCYAAVQSVFAILNRKPQIDVHDKEAKRLDNVRGSIEFKKVYFSYPARPQIPIFQDFNLKFRAGSITALVGASGSGKSTVVSLIQRFYDPNSGRVTLDGTDIRKLKVKWLRRQMALVGQEPVLFACTIEQNIAYGREAASVQEIEQAARVANVHSFISSLADGYDTQVGERGVQLSGGQKQRIAIARAILKDPKILLLDEATSALDTESESKVQAALEKVTLNRTTVIVAHRLSTIRNAHRIAVVSKGEVVELGTHEKLMENSEGAYYHLVNSQKNIR